MADCKGLLVGSHARAGKLKRSCEGSGPLGCVDSETWLVALDDGTEITGSSCPELDGRVDGYLVSVMSCTAACMVCCGADSCCRTLQERFLIKTDKDQICHRLDPLAACKKKLGQRRL